MLKPIPLPPAKVQAYADTNGLRPRSSRKPHHQRPMTDRQFDDSLAAGLAAADAIVAHFKTPVFCLTAHCDGEAVVHRVRGIDSAQSALRALLFSGHKVTIEVSE